MTLINLIFKVNVIEYYSYLMYLNYVYQEGLILLIFKISSTKADE